MMRICSPIDIIFGAVAFAIEHVEGATAEFKEIAASCHDAQAKLRIVRGLRIGHDQIGLAPDLAAIRQLSS